MKRSLRIRVADPAGNITIFVLDPVRREDYAPVAQALLAMREFRGEQVAFVTGEDSMEMCGLEFCGNASRSFALMVAEARAIQFADSAASPAKQTVTVHVSGSDVPLSVETIPEISYTKIRMPLHRRILTLKGLPGQLVDFGGIAHLVTKGLDASDEFFAEARFRIEEALNPPALGVMFCRGEEMTPVVYVRDVDTIYYEGSCGSGTTAYAIAHATGKPDGLYRYAVRQPAGTLVSSAEVTGRVVTSVWIEGEVGLSDPVTVEIDLPDPAPPPAHSAGFPSLDDFRNMVADELDQLPQVFFRDLSGGVVVEDRTVLSPYALANDLYTMGTYTVSPLGRQIRIFYGSFRNTCRGFSQERLRRRIREVVRHEFRHHMEFLSGMHGKDSLEEEDRRDIKEYLNVKR
ncbi:MAG: metallopeptidase family protein [Mogibacterium sp.]|nr:metallopeptidase family protein [Mogibacterium sp.]